ncbi:MAG: hypothetical protein [Microviridae sp.]|nr:MAG: hypothetical protein [Microviridae sp.]
MGAAMRPRGEPTSTVLLSNLDLFGPAPPPARKERSTKILQAASQTNTDTLFRLRRVRQSYPAAALSRDLVWRGFQIRFYRHWRADLHESGTSTNMGLWFDPDCPG